MEEKRKYQRLHGEDIEIIVDQITSGLIATPHFCRFNKITEQDLTELVESSKEFKIFKKKTGWIVWVITVTALVGWVLSSLVIGIVTKIKVALIGQFRKITGDDMKIPELFKRERIAPIDRIKIEECRLDECLDNLPEEEVKKIKQTRLLYKVQQMGSWF